MEADLLHIDYSPKVGWVYPIVNRVAELDGANDSRRQKWQRTGLGDLGLSISTKLRMLQTIVSAFETKISALNQELANHSEVVRHARDGYAYRIKNQNLPFSVLVDIDSFVNEAQSTYEIISAFIRKLHKVFAGKTITEKQMLNDLKRSGLDVSWIEDLKGIRAELFHQRAVWIAVKITSTDPFRMALILLRENVARPSSDKEIIEFRSIAELFEKLLSSMPKLQTYAVGLIS